ncbi:TPA: hypothetical protein NK348_001150 [Vibrio parahaemolyticus]|uniref:hypothetical protein n=1 Tax=Vibrio parahaemolyticus TaxID=670 RepID=UPI0004A2FACA|nr:hypothetical protein [Vibrio parahaemolyticus]MDG3414920.1 hypothetical protein [Vibrio parahaemolyticus]HCH6232406.1 hypothetical protein [Vibrio parahaemolyticus]HCM1463070.1 hypothetical protein [Vibrio parahaemolyticus]
MNLTVKDSEKKFLAEEYKQAWEHYRHLEDTRLKFQTLAATFFLSGLAFNGLMFRLENKVGYEVYIMAFLANLLLIMMAVYFKQSVQGIHPVLAHYEEMIKKVRLLMYSNGEEIHNYLDVRDNIKVASRTKKSRVHGLSELMLKSMVIVLLFVQMVVAYKLIVG